MSTFLDVQNRVNLDYLNRTDFTDQTKRAIKAAIHHYETRRWWFNVTATALASSAGQTYVTLPSNFLVLNDFQITVSSADFSLVRVFPNELRQMGTVRTTGEPTHFSIDRDRIELFPIPDIIYSFPTHYIKSLPELSADSDTNSWITGAMEDVIVFHAAKLMWSTVLRNSNNAIAFASLENEAVNAIEQQNNQHYSFKLKSTRF